MIDVQTEDDLQDTLYHYTDFAVLQSIWENAEVWATNARYLNDITETRVGPGLVQGVLLNRELATAGEIIAFTERLRQQGVAGDEPLPPSDADALRELYENRAFYREIRMAFDYSIISGNCFIFSLSKEPDQLSQWRAYAKDGVCIGFSTEVLRDSLSAARADRAYLKSVEYPGTSADPADISDPIIEFMRNRRDELIAEGCDDVNIRNVEIGREILMRVAFLKHAKFEEEKEVRVAVQGNPNHFTPNRYGIVPRMKLPLNPHAIRSVMVGPGAHTDLRVQSLRTYLDERGFGEDLGALGAEVELFRSSIPYRDW
ncbi:DUF2971 domain-containing protein [Mycobacterium sp. E787]|uniref:DUF2971 domain-containing protein n=1 Tax=Mycobacterium sp. E787 TaxID=1834150 RepID=UPI0007FE1B2B|nr:DUF2971 domain-containing protein [Mycobacterium sp. E787]OBI52880.1 hypothetical protein A5705_04910 [Mycobacterium sp. E787]